MSSPTSPNEILIKGADGQWYVLRGDEMVPAQTFPTRASPRAAAEREKLGGLAEGPKGVKQEVHEKFETKPQKSVTETTEAIPMSSVRAISVVSSAPAGVSHETHPLAKELEELVERVISESQLLLADPVLQKRFRTIVSARLRDVRDQMETREMLSRAQKVGGMGLKEDEVKRVTDTLERSFGEFQQKWKEVEAKRAQEWKKKQLQEEVRAEERKKKEGEELEERYRKLTGMKVEVVPRDVGQAVAPLRNTVGHPSPVVPSSAPILPRPRAASPAIQKQAEPAALRGSLGGPPPAPHPTPPTPPPPTEKREVKKPVPPPPPKFPSPPPSSVVRPQIKITDIRPAPKHLGPVEEIGSLTLEDFRRIPGNTPAERTANIILKIDFLGKESLARKMKGIEAWRICPLNQLYFQVVQASLGERTSPEVIMKKWGEAGKSTLTQDEFHAIMELNQKLRF